MSCEFCEQGKNHDYLLRKHAHFCLFCGDSLHGALVPTRDRANAPDMYKNAKTDDAGRRICPECGAIVRRSDPRAVYCSNDCQRRHNSRTRNQRRKTKEESA